MRINLLRGPQNSPQDPNSGRITVDGVDLSSFDTSAWLKEVAAAFQDFMQFEMLARETVAVGQVSEVADKQAVLAALGRASANDVWSRCPVGWSHSKDVASKMVSMCQRDSGRSWRSVVR